VRPVRRSRRVAVALVVMLVWFASLVCEAQPVTEASTLPVVSFMDLADPNWLEREAHLSQRQQLLRESALLLRTQEEMREERQRVLEQRGLIQRDVARRAVATRRIADLVPSHYQAMVLDVAEQFGLDPRVLAAVGSVESQWYANALGADGDSGLMQILPSTAQWIAGRMGLAVYDLYDPLTNLTMGAWYLHLLYHAHGDWEQALAEYNGGPRAAARGVDHPYTRLVMRVYRNEGR
jgi:soluble lytic murein transglycosylase-like protein